MTIYVLNRGYDYEGEVTLGVYSTREAAVDAAHRYAESNTRVASGRPNIGDWLDVYEFTLDDAVGSPERDDGHEIYRRGRHGAPDIWSA